MSKQKADLRLVPRSQPATAQELAQMEFRALKYFRGLSEPQRIEKTYQVIDAIRPMAVFASSIVAMEKSELIAWVKAEDKRFEEAILELGRVRDDAKSVSEIISSAVARLGVALATVEIEYLEEAANV